MHKSSWINITSNHYHFIDKETEAHGNKSTCQILRGTECEPDSMGLETRLYYIGELIKEELLSKLNLYFSLSDVIDALNFQREIVA